MINDNDKEAIQEKEKKRKKKRKRKRRSCLLCFSAQRKRHKVLSLEWPKEQKSEIRKGERKGTKVSCLGPHAKAHAKECTTYTTLKDMKHR